MRPRPAELWLWGLSACALAALAIYFAHGHGRLDFADHARGRDFVIPWTASRLLREGRAAEVFDPRPFLAAAHRTFSPRLPLHFWSYPPPALLLAAPLALFGGYFSALIAWTAAGLLALAAALRPVLRRLPRAALPGAPALLMLLSPASATNIGFGQNGAFTAALLLSGLARVETRPLLAGALLGALVFKPQIALLLPVMVLAGGRWRVLAGAATSAGAICLATLAIWGVQPWLAFLHATLPAQTGMLSHGRGPFLGMMTSAFGAVRLLKGSAEQGLWAQAPFAALGAALVWRVWRAPERFPGGRLAMTAAATFIATPQAFNYDLIPTAVAALVLWSVKGRWWDRGLAALVWALPPLVLLLGSWRAPLAPLLLTVAALRLAQLAGALPSWPRRVARASAAAEPASNT